MKPSGFGNTTGTPLPSQSPAVHSLVRKAGIAWSSRTDLDGGRWLAPMIGGIYGAPGAG